ncbi:MAG TPA: hypothetical protein VIC26_08775 [Marinagarivorans sp.]
MNSREGITILKKIKHHLCTQSVDKKERLQDSVGILLLLLIPIASLLYFGTKSPNSYHAIAGWFYGAYVLHALSQIAIANFLYRSNAIPRYLRKAFTLCAGFANAGFVSEVFRAFAKTHS